MENKKVKNYTHIGKTIAAELLRGPTYQEKL
jgi:hypothetical protein